MERRTDQDESAGSVDDGPVVAKPAPVVPKPAKAARLLFGDPLDRQTSDDTDSGWGERPREGETGGRGLDWYLSQRPPHHGE